MIRAIGAKHVQRKTLFPSYRNDLFFWVTRLSAGSFGCRNELLVSRFRRERGDEFLETRIAAQRVPERMQTKFAVIQITRDLQIAATWFRSASKRRRPSLHEDDL